MTLSLETKMEPMMPDTPEVAPGVKNGVIVDASYWLWIDEQRAKQPKEPTHD